MFKNVLRMLAGNASGQAIQMLSLLVLTTLYSTAEFGHLGNIQAIAGIAVVIFTLQLQHIVPISENDDRATSKVQHILHVIFICFLFFLFVSIFLQYDYTIASVYALILALTATFNNLLIYHSRFSVLSNTYVIRALIIVVLQFAFYYFKVKNGLFIAVITGEFIVLLYILSINRFWHMFSLNVSLREILSTIKDWRSFALYGTIQEALSVMVYSLPVIFYVDRFGETIGGQFSMAHRLTFAPIVLLSSSLAQVLTHKFGKEKDFSFLNNLIWFDKRLLFLALLIIAITFSIAHSEISIMEGKWDVSIQLIPYLLLNSLFFLFASPFRLGLRVMRRNIVILKIEVMVVIIMLSFFLFFNFSIFIFTIIMTLISFFQNILIIVGYYKYSKSQNFV